MDVTFLGICVFKVTGSTAEAFMPNATSGLGPHVPPHNAVVAVRPATVTPTNWTHTQARIPAIDPNNDFWLFPLDGVNVSFAPAPPAGSFQLGQLLRTLDATFKTCPDLTELNTTLTSSLVSAHIDLGSGALRSRKQRSGLAFTELLELANDVTVTAKEFSTGTIHSFKVTSATPMFIVNIHLAASGVHDDAEHLALYCKILEAPLQPPAPNALDVATAAIVRRLTRISKGAKGMAKFLAKKGKHKDEFTLGTGCSNTQWP
ncbi:MAG TPA: hypothetical protein VII75_02835 [Thermoanaerobaculia bacterium]|nr:hypothetical protein [Thermoanaerobaculia bacterium]